MREYIRNLRSKSEETRKLILAGSLIICMSIVVLIWVLSLGSRFSSPKVKEQARDDIKPFKLFSNSLKDTYTNMSASVDKIKSKSEDKKEEKQINLIPVEYTN